MPDTIPLARKERRAAIRPDADGWVRQAELYLFVILLLGWLFCIPIMDKVDYAWTLAISRHQVHWLSELMAQSLFEGELPGGSDGPVIFLALSLILYVIAWLRPPHTRLAHLRPHLGFIVTSGFINAVLLVHGLKFALGRARPDLVVKGGLAYSQFYQFGPHFIGDGVFNGSFPSGHTASVFALMSVAYLLALAPGRTKTWRLVGIGWAALVLGYSIVMGVARSMSMSHWIGDSLMTIFMCWLILHAVYFWGLRVPERICGQSDSRSLRVPPFWELRICWLLWWITLGWVSVTIGGRAFIKQPVPWLAVLIPAGIILLLFAGRKLYGLRQAVFPGLAVLEHLEPRVPDWKISHPE